MIKLENVIKKHPNMTEPTLKGINLTLAENVFAALIGPSGSGKTTLLNVLSGLDQPDSGRISINGIEVTKMSKSELTQFRARHVGFVFQSYNLFSTMTVLENVMYTSVIRGDREKLAKDRARLALEEMGILEKQNEFPTLLSGGQQQRVAIARALASVPKIIFADEPTANLDTKNAEQVIEIFQNLNSKYKIPFIFSTHDYRLINKIERKITLVDGSLVTT